MSVIRAVLTATIFLLVTASFAQAAPSILSPPEISGEPRVGDQLAVTDAQLDAATADDVTLTWERSIDHGFSAIPDAHDARYVPVASDLGHRLRVHVVVETADGTDEDWSQPSAAVAYGAARTGTALRIGAAPGAPARLDRWTVTAGRSTHLTGQLSPELVTADLRLVFEPTVPTYGVVQAPVSIDALGRVSADATPTVNARVWLEVAPADEAAQRIELGLVGVRPRIRLMLSAQADGRDQGGRALIRDLRLLSGSVIAPGVAGLRLSWEGMLPGDRTGTAVCRSAERVTSAPDGRLRGGCQTRGAWAAARWRLVLESGTDDPAAAPFLSAASAWVVPRLASTMPARPQVPNLPRSSATLRPWI